MRHGLATFPGDDTDRLLGGGGVSVDAEDLRALAGKGDRGRLAVTPARADRPGADHHRNLALEPIHRHSPVSFLLLCGRINRSRTAAKLRRAQAGVWRWYRWEPRPANRRSRR